ncbi:3-oxo-tetronate kinase [Paracoccus fistulariae]|uniref:3-oxo-tetronate kinase n=1 Tax=Paracoccus fistulariae TaxID=658446 RepID=A0ABY7SR83_9RHOB|nr:3-oxo-tetronate kinase [Paracoccus fistulariae]MDB6182443.1 four-carbon acid sugar kinase family protein [Paracoccus fistulariae]WCR08586.1 four-carbon acid sugar kinase family protein [Paracoccus fistulariae]
MLLGCIGDDFTGSSDLGNTLAKAGMRVVQYSGVPTGPADPDVEAGIVALKSRSLPVEEAVRLSLEALEWLQEQGCQQILFKYCSTFDSTPEGNIGPVAEALARELEADQVIFCPAFPAAGRTVYQGCLFVGDRLLNDSGMENHPLTPMTDPDLRRWLALQSTVGVGHVPAATVWQGADAVRDRIAAESDAGKPFVICDAIRDEDLLTLGAAADGAPLITGGSGIALGLPENFRRQGLLSPEPPVWEGQVGRVAVLSGSCSRATRGQVAHHIGLGEAALEIDPREVLAGTFGAMDAAEWVLGQDGAPLVFSSADPRTVRAVQAEYGTEEVAHALEEFFADLARYLVDGGVTRLITAGGETSGAVVEGLELGQLDIGPEIAPGVPAIRAGEDLVLALKSGNFGAEDFFDRAARMLGDEG